MLRLLALSVVGAEAATCGDLKAFYKSEQLGPGVGPFFLFLGLGFPYNPLKTKKGALFYS